MITHLTFVFGVFIGLIPIFATAYYVLNQRSSTSFVVASDILALRRIYWGTEGGKLPEYISRLYVLKDIRKNVRSISYVMNRPSDNTGFRSYPEYRVYMNGDKFVDCKVVIVEHVFNGGFAGPTTFGHTLEVETRAGVVISEFLPEVADFVSDKNTVIDRIIEKFESNIEVIKDRVSTLENSHPKVLTFWDFMYFSLTTQTTSGFGDIIPNTSAARSVVALQLLTTYAIAVVVVNAILAQ